MERKYLTVIIPCYNEAANLKRGVLSEVSKYLKNKKFTWEVLISDDGSTDESISIIKKQLGNLSGFRLLENPHGGKPSALNYGITQSKGKYILFSDMDQSTPIAELDKLLLKVSEKNNIVIGSRGLVRRDFPLYRKLGAIVFATVRRFLILPEITDTQCGFKLFDASALKKSFPKLEFFRNKERVSGWKVTSYDVELLHILKKMGCKIVEVPVLWNDRDSSKSKGGMIGRYIRESKEMFWQILRVRVNDWKGLY